MKSILFRMAAIFFVAVCLLYACTSSGPIKGKWEYEGGIYNGKLTNAAPEYKMQRTYTADGYEAYLIEPGAEPVKYGAGSYELKGDTFKVTSTYSSQPSQSLGQTINYLFRIEGKKLTIKGTLPNGMLVEEYWKKLD